MMKKITIAALALALIATSTKPMVPGLIKAQQGKLEQHIRDYDEAVDKPNWDTWKARADVYLKGLRDLNAPTTGYEDTIANLREDTDLSHALQEEVASWNALKVFGRELNDYMNEFVCEKY